MKATQHKIMKLIQNTMRLFCYSTVQFSAVNFVDDNATSASTQHLRQKIECASSEQPKLL